MNDKVVIRKLKTGIPGLDEVLGGGIPEYSFNLIVGSPGTGKTTFAHQFMFANASHESPALYFTIMGEPAFKMLRHQQQYTFFDLAKLNQSIRFINLSQVVMEKDLNAVFNAIVKEIEDFSPRIVIVDSFRTVVRGQKTSDMDLQSFVQMLALHLTSWQATSFLVGEYSDKEMQDNPIFSVSDGIFWMQQVAERNSIVRKMQVVKMRGQEIMPGLHTFRIINSGLHIFPRVSITTEKQDRKRSTDRISIGVPELDKMLGGGIPEADSILVTGSSGSGKSILAIQFLAEGIRQGQPGIAAIFEERPQDYIYRAKNIGLDLETPIKNGKLKLLYLRPLDLTVDETIYEVLDAVRETGATRLVIDSIAGFELALAPGFREDFRESLYRMIGNLRAAGVTILSTIEVSESFTDFPFSHYAISFLTDDIIRLRYVSIKGQLRKMITVVKMRGSKHSIDIREFEITDKGFKIGPRIKDYRALTSGIPELEIPQSKVKKT